MSVADGEAVQNEMENKGVADGAAGAAGSEGGGEKQQQQQQQLLSEDGSIAVEGDGEDASRGTAAEGSDQATGEKDEEGEPTGPKPSERADLEQQQAVVSGADDAAAAEFDSESDESSEEEEETQEELLVELADAVADAEETLDHEALAQKLKDLKLRGLLTKTSPEFTAAEELVPVIREKKRTKLRKTLEEVPVQDLQRAAYEDDVEQVNVLITKHKWHVDRRDQQTNTTPLQWSAINGKSNAIDELLRHGAAINQKDKFGRTALHYAALYGSADTAATLMKTPTCKVNAKDNRGYTPLILAAECGHVATMEALLGAGANINITNNAGASALHEAAYSGRAAAIDLLVNSGSNLVLRDADGNTATHYAAEQGHIDCVRSLLGGKADLRLCNNFKENILHVAAENGQHEFISAFAAIPGNGGASAQATQSNGTIGQGSEGGNKFSTHVGLDETDANGETPLFKAVEAQQVDATRMLVELKANINARDFFGRTPVQKAVASEDTKIALLLTSARDKQRQMAAMQGAALVQESPCLQQTDDGEQKPAQQSVEPTAAAGTVK